MVLTILVFDSSKRLGLSQPFASSQADPTKMALWRVIPNLSSKENPTLPLSIEAFLRHRIPHPRFFLLAQINSRVRVRWLFRSECRFPIACIGRIFLPKSRNQGAGATAYRDRNR